MCEFFWCDACMWSTGMHTRIYTCGGQKRITSVFSSSFCCIPLRQYLSLHWKLTILARIAAHGGARICLLQLPVLVLCVKSNMGPGDLNEVPVFTQQELWSSRMCDLFETKFYYVAQTNFELKAAFLPALVSQESFKKPSLSVWIKVGLVLGWLVCTTTPSMDTYF